MTREEILARQKLQTEEVDTPGWGTLIVSEIPATVRLQMHQEIIERGAETLPNVTAMAMLVCRAVVDDAGTRIFEDRDADILALKNQDSLVALFNAAARLNGIAPPEDIAGN